MSLQRFHSPRRLAAACAATALFFVGEAFADATTVREPRWGLPHIFADTNVELARENGREIAKDRLGQMLLLARAGRGTLAQAFGVLDAGFVDTDLETRIAGYTSSEYQAMFEALPADAQAYILAYCDGVNDTIDAIYAGTQPEPIEVNVLRGSLLGLGNDLFGNATNVSDQVDPHYKAPGGADPERPDGGYQFTPEMALAIGVIQVRNFGLNTFEEQDRLAELLALDTIHGGGDAEEIWHDYNFLNDPLAPVSVPDPAAPGYGGPLADSAAAESVVASAHAVADRIARWKGPDWKKSGDEIRDRADRREETLKRWSAWPKLGSYAWLIASNRSATGNPWLGGFPQTGIQTPSLMHYVENRSGQGISGNGMEFVGGAYVLIGHTDTVAYTTTTAQLRIIDTFFEEVVGENSDNVRYSDEGSPAAMNRRTEIIKLGGQPDISRTFWRTHERGGNGGSRSVLDFVGDAEGTAESGTVNTLVDNGASFTGAYIGGHVLILDGTGAGQIRVISGASGTTLTVASPFTTAPSADSVYVAAESGHTITAVAADSGAWMEESTTVYAFSLFQQAVNAIDIREAVRLIPSTHNFFAADNQAFNGVGTNAGTGNIGYYSSGYSRKRQGGEDKLLPLDGTVPNPLVVVSGQLTGATATTASATGLFSGEDFDPDEINYRYENPSDQGKEYVISIISGAGRKQSRRIAGNTDDTVTVEYPWGATPGVGDHFEIYEVVGMPEAVNPAEGYIANWNNKAATADDGDNFGREHRVTYLLERLAADSSWTRDDQRQINKDIAGLDGRGVLGRQLVPRLREAVDAVGNGGNPAVDTVLAQLEAQNAAPEFGRYFEDPVTATATAGEVAFLNTLINELADDIYGDELGGVVGTPTGTRALAMVVHAIDSAAGTPAGAYTQEYGGDYFNGSDWKVLVRDTFSALASGGIPADGARPNSTYNHPLEALNDQLAFTPTPQGNRGTWEQIVEAGPAVNGEFMFPLGQSGQIRGQLSGFTLTVRSIDPNATSLQPIWRDWRFLPMLHIGADLEAGDPDQDGDGVFDGFERWYYGDTSVSAKGNSDGDESTLAEEFANGSDPTDDDTDDDGLLDGIDGLDQDRLGSGFFSLKGQFKLSGVEDTFKLSGKFGTGSTVFDAAADTVDIEVTNEDGDVVFAATLPAGTLLADGTKFSMKDKLGVNDGISQFQMKFGTDATKQAQIKLKTVKMSIPGATGTAQDLRVSVTLTDTSASAERRILDERSWSGSPTSLKSGKEPGAIVYN